MADCAVAEALEATTQVASSTSATFDEGVVINGIRWATRNVDAPGTFAPYPESPGMFFQWNRKKGWNETSDFTNWDSSMPEGTEWYKENDPCPEGWRIPTHAEIESLVNTNSSWTELEGVNGRLFGSGNNILFLPATGLREHNCGVLRLDLVGSQGYYWSSAQQRSQSGVSLVFCNRWVSLFTLWRVNGRSIRCVAK